MNHQEHTNLVYVRKILEGTVDITRLIERGGYSDVYGGEWKGQEVAVKVASSTTKRDIPYTSRRNRLKNEIELLQKLHHPNIAPCYTFGEVDANMYAVLPYVGCSLDNVMPEPSMLLSIHDLVYVTTQVVAGIKYLHRNNIIHGDIKPSNITLFNDGIVKIIDLGVARHTQQQKQKVVDGTPLYASPEQLEGKFLGPSSDWYSFGVTTYVLATGCCPYTQVGNSTEEWRQAKYRPRAPLRQLRSQVPKDLGMLIDACINPYPKDRPVQRAIEEIIRIVQKDIGEVMMPSKDKRKPFKP